MMTNTELRVLHIDSQFGWRGGQQQATYLLEKMHHKGLETAMVCQPKSELENYCIEKNLPFFPIRMYNELDIIAGFRIASLCRQNRFNIIHLHAAHAHSLGLWTKLFYRNLKLISTRRVDFSIKNSFLSKIKYTNFLVDSIVCISDLVRKVMIDDGVPEHMLTTIHSGVDIHKFDGVKPSKDFRKSLGVPEDHFLVGTVAAIVGHKDYPNLLNAARIVIDQTEKITFCAVGDGELKEKIFSIADNLKLGNRFIFTGYRNDVGNFFKSFDLFVLSSRLEGLGTSILDAQAVGLPVVACRTGGIPEIIQNNSNGILVPLNDSEALAKAILLLVNNEKKRNALGSKAKESVKQFSVENTISQYLILYDQLLKSVQH